MGWMVSYHALVSGELPCIWFSDESSRMGFIFTIQNQKKKWCVHAPRGKWTFRVSDGTQEVKLEQFDGVPMLSYSPSKGDVNTVCFVTITNRDARESRRTLLETPRWLERHSVCDSSSEHFLYVIR